MWRSLISEEDVQWQRSKISRIAAALMLQFELSEADQCNIKRQILRRSYVGTTRDPVKEQMLEDDAAK
jgi:hypothetical protein